MAHEVVVEVLGFHELDAVHRDLPRKVTQKIGRAAIEAASNRLLTAVKERAPVKTGLLFRSVVARVRRTGNRIMGIVETAGGMYQGKAFYGAFVELGHIMGQRLTKSDRSALKAASAIKDLGRRLKRRAMVEALLTAEYGNIRVPAHPFMRPAFDGL